MSEERDMGLSKRTQSPMALLAVAHSRLPSQGASNRSTHLLVVFFIATFGHIIRDLSLFNQSVSAKKRNAWRRRRRESHRAIQSRGSAHLRWSDERRSTSRLFLHGDGWATVMMMMMMIDVVALLDELGARMVSCERVRVREGDRRDTEA